MPDPAATPLTVRPWLDPIIDTLGHDPRSLYVERFWLPTLGPTTLLLLRHFAHRFEQAGPAATESALTVDLPEISQSLGLGPRVGANSVLVKTLGRLQEFDLACLHPDGALAVRRSVPPISRRHVRRLPPGLLADHEAWLARSDGPRAIAERRARRAAFVLAELGTDVDTIERALHHLGHRPGVCREAAAWADDRHRALERSHEAELRHPSSAGAADAA